MAASHVACPSWADPSSDVMSQPVPRQTEPEIMIPRQTPSPVSDGTEDEDILYGDQDDAQSFIQPAISPVATRLTSPKTTAAERAAAMERLGADISFDGSEDQESIGSMLEPATTLPGRKLSDSRGGEAPMTLASPPPQRSKTVREGLPAPWQSRPKDFIVDEKTRKPALTGVFGSSTRPRRSTSMGENALKRISKALDSVNLPSFSSSSFFSSTSPHKHAPISSPSFLAQSRSVLQKKSLGNGPPSPGPVSEKNSLALKRTISDDSVLYHSLSHVSSFGDDDRFTHIREQVNVRLKAIKDSFDAPTFKIPSKHNNQTRPSPAVC